MGQTLTAGRGDIDDDDGLSGIVFPDDYGFRWIRNDGTDDEDIADATGPMYRLTGEDEGKTIRVEVSFVDDEGNSEARTSVATAAVAPDTTSPLFQAATIDGVSLAITYDEPLDGASVPAHSAFTVKVDGNGVTLAAVDPVTVAGSKVTLILAMAVDPEDMVTVSYAVPQSDPIRTRRATTRPV